MVRHLKSTYFQSAPPNSTDDSDPKAITKRAGRKKDDPPKAQAAAGSAKPQVQKAVFESSKKKEIGVSDLTLISKISNEAINDNLKKRFENGEIYTYIGHVLVSVNPFRDLGIYTDEVLGSYRGKNRLEMPPHVFAVAESAYYNMKGYNENQCVIISGESGAGKTEAAKRIMQYIANVSEGTDSSIQQIKDMVLATNPLLESFGNAKTLRNNNSSRFGKYLELQFNAQGEPVGANITNYLLEKSRVVGQIQNERNFHIFYQFTQAASPKYREMFGLQEALQYTYTSNSDCLEVQGIDDAAEYAETLKAMGVIGLAQAEQDNIFRMLAVILWIGNVSFIEDGSGNAAIPDAAVVDFIAYLLEVEPGLVNRALTLRVVETSRGGRRGSIYDVPLNRVQAVAVRDALAKAIYNNLFDWIVARVNASLKARGAPAHSIGILDIYGFEIFERNSFEQLCINYVNEKLQQIFIQLTLKTEQEEYAREQIKWTPINYFDNKVVCDLIEEKRPPGILAALNDACATAHADSGAADSAFVQRLSALSSHPHFQPRQGQFIVKHYAGDVSYAVESMTDKNKDQLLKDLLNLVGASQNPFLRNLFPEKVDQDSKRRPPTAGDKIKASANDLVATLMKSSPSYIRTIKPNDNKSPKEYNVTNVMHQIKYLGLQENVRIRRAGFAYRQTFEKFVERFYLLSPKTSYAGDYIWTGDALSGTRQILKDTSIPADEYQMGVTKAFIKTPETLFALEHMRDRYWHNMAVRIQRAWRNYLRYRVECAIRIQRWWRRLKGGLEYIQLRDYGHQVLQRKKERRRFSLLGSRRFMGDYLAVNSGMGFAEMLRGAINGSEKVLFSCRCDLLVAKFGRSSRPSPRLLVLTPKAVYLIIQAVNNQQLSISTERAIPLGSIKYVSTSIYRDDWFAIGVGAPQEPDPLINCVLKTEFFTHLSKALRGGLNLKIGPMIEYDKKPGKPATVQVVKEPNAGREDVYKSGSIHTGPGEPADSVSRPTPRGKEGISKPINVGKLLRRGGPGGRPSNGADAGARRQAAAASPMPLPKAAAAGPSPQPRPTSQSTAQPSIPQTGRIVPQPVQATPSPSAQAYAPTAQQSMAAAAVAHSRTGSAASTRAPPPPPPAQPAASREPRYRVLYDFQGQTTNELNLKKDELVIVVQKENNGWWLAKRPNSMSSGWTPSAYLKEEPGSMAPPPPPPPSSARPVPAPPAGSSEGVRTTGVRTSFPPPGGVSARETRERLVAPRSSSGVVTANSGGITSSGLTAGGAGGATRSKPAPPAPPAKRPAGRGAKPAPPPPPAEERDSGVSLTSVQSGMANGGSGAGSSIVGGSGRNTPNSSANVSLAGGLAEALRARQSAMQGKKEDDDDW